MILYPSWLESAKITLQPLFMGGLVSIESTSKFDRQFPILLSGSRAELDFYYPKLLPLLGKELRDFPGDNLAPLIGIWTAVERRERDIRILFHTNACSMDRLVLVEFYLRRRLVLDCGLMLAGLSDFILESGDRRWETRVGLPEDLPSNGHIFYQGIIYSS